MATMNTMNATQADILSALESVLPTLNGIEQDLHRAKGYTSPPEVWHIKERLKFYALDIGNSGAFLIEKHTGELYNISGYGRPDYNKKRKADLGNILTVNVCALYQRRWNYLR